MNFKFSAIEIIPLFYIRFRPIESILKFGVPWNPLAISATPKGPSPQLLISKTYNELAEFKKFNNALAP